MGNGRGILLGFHILAGTIALIIAPLAMLTVKGGLWHRRWGKIYFWAMTAVAVSAVALCLLGSGLFLFLIALFSFYLALTGYRVLKQKVPGAKPPLLDVFISVLMLLVGIGFAVLGVKSGDSSERWVRITFGSLCAYFGIFDLVRFFRPPKFKRAWLLTHMTRFLGAYVATVTAFSVVNFKFLPYFSRWLWPTVVGIIGTRVWQHRYKKQGEAGRHDHGSTQ